MHDQRYRRTCRQRFAGRVRHVLPHQARPSGLHHEYQDTGDLSLKPPSQPIAFELYPPDEDGLWAIRLNVSVKIRFDEDEEGRVVSFTTILPDGVELVRPRVDDSADDEEDPGETGG